VRARTEKEVCNLFWFKWVIDKAREAVMNRLGEEVEFGVGMARKEFYARAVQELMKLRSLDPQLAQVIEAQLREMAAGDPDATTALAHAGLPSLAAGAPAISDALAESKAASRASKSAKKALPPSPSPPADPFAPPPGPPWLT